MIEKFGGKGHTIGEKRTTIEHKSSLGPGSYEIKRADKVVKTRPQTAVVNREEKLRTTS